MILNPMILKQTGYLILMAAVTVGASASSSFANTIDFTQIKHCKDSSFQVPALFQGFYGADQLGAVQGLSVGSDGADTLWNNMQIKDVDDGQTYAMTTEFYQSFGYCSETTIKSVDGLQTLEITLRKDTHQVICSGFVKHVFQVRYSPIALSHSGPMFQIDLNSQIKSWGLCGSYYNERTQLPFTELPAPRPQQ